MNTIIDVKKIRIKKGLTQKELAKICGVTVRTIQNWENGATIPDLAQKHLLQINEKDEIISSNATGNSVSVAAGKGSNVNVGSEAERLLTMLEHSQKQIDQHLELAKNKDEQIAALLSIIDKLTNSN